MTPAARVRASAGRAVLLLVAAACTLAACGHAPAFETTLSPRRAERPDHYRAPDGLLSSRALQHVVDLQLARDGAALADALGDADPRVRARAAFALASVQDSAAVGALIPLLDDADARVRADAAFALGQTPSAAGAAALLQRAYGESDTLALALLLDALGRAGTAAELARLAEDPIAQPNDARVSLAEAQALAFARFAMRDLHDEAAIDWVVDALLADEPDVRASAAYFFARSRTPAVWSERREQLLDALARYGEYDRAAMHLLPALARIGDLRDAHVAAGWLRASPDWAIRVNAVRALGRFATLVHDDDPERMAGALAARDALIAALDDASHHVRLSAAQALAALPAGIEPAQAAARLERLEAEPAAYGALLRALALADPGAAFERWSALADRRLRRAALGALVVVPGRAAFDALAVAARDADSTLASAAVAALAERRTGNAVRLLERDMQDADLEAYFDVFADALRTRDLAVSTSAAGALADSAFRPLGAGPLLQSVVLQLEAPRDLEAMVEMLRALGSLRDRTAEPLLREMRASAWPELRRVATQSLARIREEEPDELPLEPPPPTRPMQWDWLAQWGRTPRLRLETTRGTLVIELSVEQAPQTAQTLLTLAQAGEFDGTPFHRVVPNFVIQGGDVSRGDGWGGPGFAIRTEITRVPYLRGTAGMASAGKDTEGSQFFVTHSMQPHLDVAYTAFGTLIEGIGALDAIREGDLVIRATPERSP